MTTGTDYIENIVQVAAGRSGEYSMALASDKTVWAWGYNNYGQLGNGESVGGGDYTRGVDDYQTTPVKVVGGVQGGDYLEDIVDIDAGIYHSIAVDNTTDCGYVWTWGINDYGQLGDGSTTDSDEPVKVGKYAGGDLQNVVDVTVCSGLASNDVDGTDGASFALDWDGEVWAWGNNDFGKLGQGSFTPAYETKAKEIPTFYNKHIIAISAGNHHVLALENDPVNGNRVWAWGKNRFGQLGNGSSGSSEMESTPARVQFDDEPTYLDEVATIVYIDAGFEHSLAIDNQNRIWVWGRNAHAELGTGDIINLTYATQQ